jgi:hypothetical protein
MNKLDKEQTMHATEILTSEHAIIEQVLDCLEKLVERGLNACLHGHSRPSIRAQTGLHVLCAVFRAVGTFKRLNV